MLGCNNDNLTTVSHQAQQPTTTLSSDKLPPPDSMFMTRIASITLNSHHCSETRLEREQNGLFRKELRKKYKDTSISGCKMIFYPHVVYRQGLPNKGGNKRSGREHLVAERVPRQPGIRAGTGSGRSPRCYCSGRGDRRASPWRTRPRLGGGTIKGWPPPRGDRGDVGGRGYLRSARGAARSRRGTAGTGRSPACWRTPGRGRPGGSRTRRCLRGTERGRRWWHRGEGVGGGTTDGDTTDGDTTDGDTTYWEVMDGFTMDGDTMDGDTTHGDTTHGDTTSNKAEPVAGHNIGKGLCLRKICGKSLLLGYRQQWAAVLAPQSVRKMSLNWAAKPPFQLLSAPERYKHHWFPLAPSKGSGYRCIRINHKMDPLIVEAAGMIGLSHERLFQLLPSELTLWVDPFEVSYRIGENGSICVLYKSPQPSSAISDVTLIFTSLRTLKN
ncbi:Protein BTG1 [Anas platyrhynchos]|uniref:Protein BTG1 n=1 Tax=Anas platyrhynchos TaxID=8839 RepID=R0JIA6_ANAPL|nr:Protein BTG1 [Anas platyrhynchos]